MPHESHITPGSSIRRHRTSLCGQYFETRAEEAPGDNKISDPRHLYRQIGRSIQIRIVNFERQAIGQPSFEPLSP